MRGYRTLIFAAIMAVAGVFGHHLAPDIVNSYLDIIFAVAAVGVAVMRLLTSTPVGLAAHPALADLANLLTAATAKEASPVTAAPDANAGPVPDAPATGGATVTGPPMNLLDLAASITNAWSTIQGVHAEMVSTLQAANDKVSAALPVAIIQSADSSGQTQASGAATIQPSPQSASAAPLVPQPAAAAAGQS